MYNKIYARLIFCLGLIVLGCTKDNSESRELKLKDQESVRPTGAGATQVSGIGYFDPTDECNSSLPQGAAYAIILHGDLEGCHYFFIDEFECSPSGTYREVGRELFVGTYNGQQGSFRTTYKFEAKYEGCNEDGSYVGAEILGRCQHPIVEGSGTGVFEGVTGRLNFKDDIAAGNYPFEGHFRY
jgi:hypothetical protein